MQYRCLTLRESYEEMPYCICCDEDLKKLSHKDIASGNYYTRPFIRLIHQNASDECPDLLLSPMHQIK